MPFETTGEKENFQLFFTILSPKTPLDTREKKKQNLLKRAKKTSQFLFSLSLAVVTVAFKKK